MSAPHLVYVTRIHTTATRLWEALTQPEFIRQYWFGCHNTSTWKTGDSIEGRSPEGELDWQGKILHVTPEKEVSFTFDHLTGEAPSRVTFTIEQVDESTVQLTVLHDEFPEISAIRDRVSNGWPKILEGIKALLETGSVETIYSPCKA